MQNDILKCVVNFVAEEGTFQGGPFQAPFQAPKVQIRSKAGHRAPISSVVTSKAGPISLVGVTTSMAWVRREVEDISINSRCHPSNKCLQCSSLQCRDPNSSRLVAVVHR